MSEFIDVDDDIGSVYAAVVSQFTERPEEPVNFRIDSLGGSLDDAIRVYNYIKENKIVATALVTGNCMSAATVILCSVPYIYRYAYITSQFLIHSAAVPYQGVANKSDLQQLTNLIDVKNSQLKNIYAACTTIGEQVDSYMDSERLFDANEAVKLGFVNQLISFENKKAEKEFSDNQIINMNIFKKLKEVINVTTVEGQELPVDDPKVGAACKADDGIYVLEDGTKITIEDNKITEVEKPEKQKADEQNGDGNSPVEDGCGDKKKKPVAEETVAPGQKSSEQKPDAEPDIQSQIDAISKKLDDIASRLSVLESLNTDITNKVKAIQKVQNTAKFVSDKEAPKKAKSLKDLMSL